MRLCLCAGVARDVDHVITTAELGKIFVERGIKLSELPESEFDSLIGEGTGGAVLFGTTGGVMEAALRTVCEQVRWKQRWQGRQLARGLPPALCHSRFGCGCLSQRWLCCVPSAASG